MANYCCLCKRKIGAFSVGFEISSKARGYNLCRDCNTKKLDIRAATTKELLEQRVHEFDPILKLPSTPACVVEEINRLVQQARNNITLREDVMMKKFNGEKPIYQFSTYPVSSFIDSINYSANVHLFADRIHIEREGKTMNLPSEMVIYFREATSVYWGETGNYSWIAFTVPGAKTLSDSGTPTAILKNGMVLSPNETVPFRDPNAIVFDTRQEERSEMHFREIQKHYNAYKSKRITEGTVVHQDGAIDKLKKLMELKELGILSSEEYEEKRRKLISEI